MNFDIRWAGQPHETLYNWINGGPGSPASTPQLEYWSKLKGSLADINTKLEDHLSRLGVSWEGVAADSAQRGLTPLKSWAERAQGAADVMNSSAQDQADYIATARANMPEPVKVSTPAPTAWQANQANAAAAGGNKGPAQAIAEQAADHEAQEQASSAASDRATQVMELYQKSSNGNASTLAVFEEPKGVIVAVNLPDGSNTADVVYSKGPGSPFVAETVGPGGVMTSEPGVGGPAGWTHGGGLDFAGSAGTASGGGESLAVGRGYGVVGEVADELLIGSFAGLGGPPTKGSTERGIDDAASGESAGDPVPIEEEPYAMSLSGGSITGSDDEERHGHSSSSEHERAQHSSVDSSSGQSNAQPDGQQDVQQSNAQPSNAQPNAQPTAQQHVQPAQPAQPNAQPTAAPTQSGAQSGAQAMPQPTQSGAQPNPQLTGQLVDAHKAAALPDASGGDAFGNASTAAAAQAPGGAGMPPMGGSPMAGGAGGDIIHHTPTYLGGRGGPAPDALGASGNQLGAPNQLPPTPASQLPGASSAGQLTPASAGPAPQGDAGGGANGGNYLVDANDQWDNDVWGVSDMVAPPVLGEE